MDKLKSLVMELIAAQERGEREQWQDIAGQIAELEEEHCAFCHKTLERTEKDQIWIAEPVSIRGTIYVVCLDCRRAFCWLEDKLMEGECDK